MQPGLLKEKLEHVGVDSPLNCHRQKFSDDSAISEHITNYEDNEYRELIKDFMDWCL